MYIALNGTYLTNDGSGTYLERQITAAQEFTLNGTRITQVAKLLRAVSVLPYDRGNLSNTLRFKVTRGQGYFQTVADSESFLVSHFSSLPGSGPLLITCGLSTDTPVLASATVAVLEGMPSTTYRGVSVVTSYKIICGQISIGAYPSTINIDCGTI